MRKFLSLIILVLLTSLNGFALKLVGQIIYPNDTLTVTFVIPVYGKSNNIDYVKIQDKVKFIDSLGKKHVLRPDDAIEMKFQYKGKQIRMVSIPMKNWLLNFNPMQHNIFLRIISNGKIKMFNFYKSLNSQTFIPTIAGPAMYSNSPYQTDSDIVIKLGDNIAKPSGWLNFKERIVEYLSDCPELIKIVNERNMSVASLQWVINEYNKKCGAQ